MSRYWYDDWDGDDYDDDDDDGDDYDDDDASTVYFTWLITISILITIIYLSIYHTPWCSMISYLVDMDALLYIMILVIAV